MGRGGVCVLAIVTLGTAVLGAQSGATFAGSSNLARGRPYTLSPRPNYSLTTDAGDDTQLTDGTYANWNPIWTKTSTVGWSGASPVTIVIDLQSVQPIGGVSYSTAAGKAGVNWPRSIFVLTSDDGQRYFPAGDLVPLSPASAGPPVTGYAAFRYVTRGLHTHGRYVAVIVDTVGPYAFSDEIEVLAGDTAWVSTPLTGTSTTDLSQFFIAAHTARQIQRRLAADLDAARTALAAARVAADLRTALAGELNDIEADIEALPAPDPSFRAVLPLNDLHTRIFAVQGALVEATGWPALTAWAVNPWDFAQPLDKSPALGSERVSMTAMAGETRSGAISVSNSTSRPLTAFVQLDAGDGSAPSDVSLYHVAWTDTRELIPVADALVPLPGGGASIALPPGMTQQIWLRFSPSNRSPGRYPGYVRITTAEGPSSRVPFDLTVLAGQFPAQPTLHFGGFDYTDSNRGLGLGLTPNNRDAVVRQLQAMGVDTPWARGSVLQVGTFDALGRSMTRPDTSAFDSWIARWPGARRYAVFVNAGDAIAGIPSTDARFTGAVAQWITFWVARAASRGVEAAQLVLLLVDEPQTTAQTARVVSWARAIKSAAPAVTIWEDPLYPDPATSVPAALDVSDVLSINRGLMVQQGAAFVDFYRQRGRLGQALDVYGSSGPARLLDPYTYDRLQAWVAIDLGATSSSFWSFSDDASGHSWNEYATTTAPYSPLFLSDSEVTISKHSEAMREGLEDVEYLVMLRKQTAQQQSDPLGLAATAAARVLQSSGSTNFQWTANKDRSVAEDVRLMIAGAMNAGPSVVPAPAPAPPPVVAACPCSIWSSAAQPSHIEFTDGQPIELGMQFRSAVNGTAVAIRFYKGATNTGPHFGHLWTSSGRLVATVAFANESDSGWQEARFTTPVAIAANTAYVVSYHTTTGNYAVDDNYFSGSAADSGPLHALSSDESAGGNGVYLYGPSGFPTETYEGSNYWVDVVMTSP